MRLPAPSPMLARKWGDPSLGDLGVYPYVYSQPKLDGVRCITTKDGMFTRSGRLITSCPNIWRVIEPIMKVRPGWVLDGELYNHDYRDNFGALSGKVRRGEPCDELQYWVFDQAGDRDHLGFGERFGWGTEGMDATQHFHGLSPFIICVPTRRIETQRELDKQYARCKRFGFEGQIIRRDGVPYEYGKRSLSLLKRKEFLDEEFRIVEVHEGKGAWEGCARSVTCLTLEGKEFKANIVGDYDWCAWLMENWQMYDRATVRYMRLTVNGIPREPRAVAFHAPGERI